MKTKKIYTGEVKKLSVKNLDLNPGAVKKIAFQSTTIKKDALFYMNFMGVPISIEHNTKLLSRDEAEYYIRDFCEKFPDQAMKVSCLYAGGNYSFSHETTNEELKQLIKKFKEERKNNKRK